MKQATLKLMGMDYKGLIHRMTYMDGGAALRMIAADHEPIATLTVSVAEYKPPTVNHCVIKDYSENAGVYDQLVKLGIVRGTGERVQTGWVTCPIAEIIAPELRE